MAGIAISVRTARTDCGGAATLPMSISGFEVTGTLNPPKGAPPLTAMWRYPGG
jgi:hypothetical protein